MSKRSGLARVEPIALGFALASPVAMLALTPDGLAALASVLPLAAVLAALYGAYRLLVRGRPRAERRPLLVPPPIGPAPAEIRSAPFRLLRRGAVVLDGTFEDVAAAARAGRVRPFDVVAGAGAEVAPADLADLVPWVASRWEERWRRMYGGWLAGAVAVAFVALAALAAGRLGIPDYPEISPLAVLLFASALVPLPFLRREWRRIADGRARGFVPEPPPRRTLGSAPLDAAIAGPAPATRAVLVVVVAVSAVAMLLPQDVLLERLAKDNDAIRRGELWRLLTAGLVHGGAFHLFVNASVLSDLGRVVERLFGARKMLAVLWGGVLAGSIASFATNPHPSVGISGGLFALVGALLAVGLRHRRTLPPPARRMLLRGPIEIIVLNVALGLVLPIIDNAAHLGGLAGGFLLGLALGVRSGIARAMRARPEPPGSNP